MARKKKTPETPLGPLALPMPSPQARAESLEDGSLLIRDTTEHVDLLGFMRQVLGLLKETSPGPTLETPRLLALTLDTGLALTAQFAEGVTPDRAAVVHMLDQAIAAVEGKALTPKAFRLQLVCGCGVEITAP